jgi:hypothetical protein
MEESHMTTTRKETDSDPEEHPRVLHAAELGTLPDVGTGRPRLDPGPVGLAGDDVGLAGELRDPEAVNHVGGLERDERARRPRGVADRDVQLVGRHDPQLRIANLPPPLVPHHRDLDRVAGGRRPLDREDVPGCRQEQDDHDEKRHDGPRQLDLRAAVHLGRIAAVVSRAVPAADDRVDCHARHDDKDARDDRKHQERQVANGERRGGHRREYARRRWGRRRRDNVHAV